MEYILYNKIKEQLIKDYNNLIGGNDNSLNNTINQITYKPLITKLNSLENTLKTLEKSTQVEKLNKNITNYKKNIENVIIKVDKYLKQLEEQKDKFYPEDLKKFYNESKFSTYINNYNDKLSKISWTNERINNEIYNSSNETNPEIKDEIYTNDVNDVNNNIIKFNKDLIQLFKPFLTEFNELLNNPNKFNNNIQNNINKIEEFIISSQKYKKYIIEKKQNIDIILNMNYDDNDCSGSIIDNSNNIIKREDFLEELKEVQDLQNSQKLNIKNIVQIDSVLLNVISGLEINKELESIQGLKSILELKINEDLNLNNINFEKLFSLKNIVKIQNKTQPLQKGGQQIIITNETNKTLFKLLELTEKLYSTLDTILIDSKYLQQIQMRYNFYLMYIFLIIYQTKSTTSLRVYKYLSLEIIQIYLKIFENIKFKFNNLLKDDKFKFTQYLNKYHYITIDKLINLFNFLKGKLISQNLVIDVFNCKNNILFDLNLFNHFKSIIKDYINNSEGVEITKITDEEKKIIDS
jgi:hypothetical protein